VKAGALRVQSQPGPQSETLSQEKKVGRKEGRKEERKKEERKRDTF
jgi:hypothetical protein